MSTDSIATENTMIVGEEIHKSSLARLLPHTAWGSQVAFLRAIFRAKKALYRIEKEAEILNF